MSAKTKRATVYLEPELHRALKIKAAESSKSVSEIINEVVRETLIGYTAGDPESWLDESFKTMDQAGADSGGNSWKREELYDV
jgi:plasmid stability protein